MDMEQSSPDKSDGQAESGDLLRRTRSEARAFFSGARGSHDWEHTERVFRLCERIGAAEDADMAVVGVAAYLHDIGRGLQDSSNGAVCHAEKGARMARPIVESLPLDSRQKENVIHCVRSHRYRGEARPRTPEARVLFDADKLDAIGAVGVARAFLFAGEVGARLHNPEVQIEETRPYTAEDTGYREYTLKLSKIRDRMLTREGRRLADARHEFMAAFFSQLQEEYEGKR